MKQTVRATTLGFTFSALIILSGVALSQQIDVAVGGNITMAPAGSTADSHHSPQSLNNGQYASVNADILLHKRIGLEVEGAWRWRRGTYVPGGYNQPYRPIFLDANALWMPQVSKRMYAELMGGVGVDNTRFYAGSQTCGFVSCTSFVSSNHFMGHLGGGFKYYVFRNFFIRPEAHVYIVHNNVEFSSDHLVRYGVSIGYTFRKQ